MKKKILLALTGPMGGGKSFAASVFKKYGAHTIDADAVSRRVLMQDLEAIAEIKKVLGDSCFDENGDPKIKKIAELVFADSNKLLQLEAIIHPRVEAYWMSAAKKTDGLIVVEIPLLFEKKLEKRFDICATVSCSESVRLGRLAKRGLSPEEIASRDSFQLSAQEKEKLADVVFFNDSTPAFLEEQIKLFIDKLYGRRK